jgi:uncharacterized membrane protein YoaK (UPF0700 family)
LKFGELKVKKLFFNFKWSIITILACLLIVLLNTLGLNISEWFQNNLPDKANNLIYVILIILLIVLIPLEKRINNMEDRIKQLENREGGTGVDGV